MSYASKTLEFDIILNEISKYAYTATTKKEIGGLAPYQSIKQVRTELQQTSDALSVIFRLGSFALIEDFDIFSNC